MPADLALNVKETTASANSIATSSLTVVNASELKEAGAAGVAAELHGESSTSPRPGFCVAVTPSLDNCPTRFMDVSGSHHTLLKTHPVAQEFMKCRELEAKFRTAMQEVFSHLKDEQMDAAEMKRATDDLHLQGEAVLHAYASYALAQKTYGFTEKPIVVGPMSRPDEAAYMVQMAECGIAYIESRTHLAKAKEFAEKDDWVNSRKESTVALKMCADALTSLTAKYDSIEQRPEHPDELQTIRKFSNDFNVALRKRIRLFDPDWDQEIK